jgi:hypothetical protein
LGGDALKTATESNNAEYLAERWRKGVLHSLPTRGDLWALVGTLQGDDGAEDLDP